jgi:SAM-dependent methyltransferase
MSGPAEGYESYMVPTLFGPWADRLVSLANPQPGERVLDLACGTGVVARRIVSRLGESGDVTGYDLNPDMLEVARAAAEAEQARVEWRQGSADRLPFPDGSYDLVLCQFAIMFFADKARALQEVRRVLRSHGRVVASVWQGLDRHPFYQTLVEVIERRVGIPALCEIFSLASADKLRQLFADAGLEDIDVRSMSLVSRFPNPEQFLAAEIDVDTAAIPAMQHADADERRRIVDAIAADMSQPLAAVTRDDHVVIEFHAHLLSARRN